MSVGGTRLAVLRHAETTWNVARRIQGLSDAPLTDAARERLRESRVPARFAGYRWVASPLTRARETAKLLGCATPEVDARLAEMAWGEWEGQTLARLRATQGEAMRRNEARGLDFRPPGGESPRDVQARLASWLEMVHGKAEPVLAVTHKGVVRSLLALATGWDMTDSPPVSLEWEALHLFEIDAERLRLVEPNIALERR